MEDDILDEEFSIMYDESERNRVLDSNTFLRPVKTLKLKKPIIVEADQTVMEALTIMRVKNFGCVLATSGEHLEGILTERDVVTKALGGTKDPGSIKVREIMTPNPVCLQPDDSIAFVLNAMHVGGYRHIPIVDEQNRPLAVVSVKDIVGFIVESFPDEILNLPPHPIRHTDEREGA